MNPMPAHHGGTAMGLGMRMDAAPSPIAAASFLAMWTVMMVAMMLPSLAPALWRYRGALRVARISHASGRTALFVLGYFAVWTTLGAAVFGLEAGFHVIESIEPAVGSIASLGVGVVIAVAGALQFSGWKARRLARCRGVRAFGPCAPHRRSAWSDGVALGLSCTASCAGPTASLVALGLMNAPVMLVVTAAITAERLAPAGVRVARASGAIAIAAGFVLLARAIGAG